MNTKPTVSDLLDSVSRLGAEDFENFFKKLAILYVQRIGMSDIPQEEAELLIQINKVYPAAKLERLQFLDWKLETTNGLSEKEAAESLRLATAYESYTVRRLQSLVKLADLRNVSLDELMVQLELKPLTHALKQFCRPPMLPDKYPVTMLSSRTTFKDTSNSHFHLIDKPPLSLQKLHL
ncbi:MAG: hypothetical protein IPM36_17080 [Lewinellaceae bacterium]|nr:hypothetical protein [Lewinellaceae bacterium]